MNATKGPFAELSKRFDWSLRQAQGGDWADSASLLVEVIFICVPTAIGESGFRNSPAKMPGKPPDTVYLRGYTGCHQTRSGCALWF